MRLARHPGGYDPCPAKIKIPRKVLKGGSHPCAPSCCRPLPPGRAPRRAGRSIHEPRRIAMCHPPREDVMTVKDRGKVGPKTGTKEHALDRRSILLGGTTLAAAAIGGAAPTRVAQAQQQPAASGQQPNIVFIMGDDIGWFNIGAYHQGVMASRTPNLDKLASEGMRFTDYYAEASCTAGRANFITGELPIRTGLTTVGQAGADVG